MTADQRKKLIEIQDLSRAWRTVHELLTEQHPFTHHWEESL